MHDASGHARRLRGAIEDFAGRFKYGIRFAAERRALTGAEGLMAGLAALLCYPKADHLTITGRDGEIVVDSVPKLPKKLSTMLLAAGWGVHYGRGEDGEELNQWVHKGHAGRAADDASARH